MEIRGARVLVTGASSGVGRAAASIFAARGATVLAHGRDEAALAEVAAATGGVALPYDLAQAGAARALATRAGRVDVLIANAGVGHAGDLSSMDEDLIARLIQVNLTAHIELTRAVLPGMLARGRGAIVFVTSIAGRMGVAGEAVYAATKAGLDTFAESLRLETTGISVGVLVPGVVDTAFFARRGQPYHRSRPRPIPAEVAARAVVRLAETGRAEAYRPRWLRLPVLVRTLAPGAYRWLARRFGGS